jgi:uncharacterized protein YoxC
MNALAKVLVVLVLVLSVGFAAAEIVLYAKREDYGKKYIDEAKKHAAVQEALNGAQKQLSDTRRDLDTLKEKKDTEILTLKTSLDNEKARSVGLDKEVGQLTTSVQGLTGTTNGLRADVNSRDRTIEGLRAAVAEREQAIKRNLDQVDGLQKAVAERDAKIADLDIKLTDTKKTLAKVTESETQLEAIIAELVQRGIQVPPVPLPLIDGRIVGVRDGVAVVDRGSKEGVKPNTQFVIYNGDGYVGRLIIHDVQPDVSAGQLRLLAKEVALGDSATTRIP